MTSLAAGLDVTASMWSALDRSSLGLRWWHDEAVVFVGSSAATHLLGVAGSQVLRILLDAQRPLSIDEILQSDVIDQDPENDSPLQADDERQALAELLAELHRIGLVVAQVP